MRKFECPECQEVIQEKCIHCNKTVDQIQCNHCEFWCNLKETDICPQCKNPLKELLVIVDLKEEGDGDKIYDGKYRFISQHSYGALVIDENPNMQLQFTVPKGAAETAYKELGYLIDSVRIGKTNHPVVTAPFRTKEEKFPSLVLTWEKMGNFEKINSLKQLISLVLKLRDLNVAGSLKDSDVVIRYNSLYVFPLREDSEPLSDKALIELITSFLTSSISSEDFVLKTILAKEPNERTLEEIQENLDILKESLETRFTIESFGMTDLGPVRDNNEDDFFAVEFNFSQPDNLCIGGRSVKQRGLYILCDGMGGHQKGEVASALIVRELRKRLMPFLVEEVPPAGFEDEIKEIIKEANDVLLEVNILEGIPAHEGRMGTTLVCVIAFENELFIAHVGDSRCYRITKGELSLLTEDHNLSMQALHAGTFKTRGEAEQMRGGKVLTQAIGPREGIHLIPDAKRELIRSDCYILLCSDGLSDEVKDDEVKEIIRQSDGNARRIVRRLINKAYQNKTRDNITVILIKFTQKF